MARPHIPVALRNSPRDTQIPVLPVHVVRARTGVITQPNTEILNLNWSLLGYPPHGDDLTGGLLEFFQLSQEIPKPGFGDD